jgi:membrane protein
MWPRVRALPREAGRAALAGLHHGITNYAAALTFYSLLALFPALIIVVALLAAFGQTSASHMVVSFLEELAPAGAAASIRGPITQIISQHANAGTLVSLGVVIGIWSASGYVACFIWAVERIYPVAKTPSFWQGLRRQLLFAVVILLLLALMTTVTVVGGPLATRIGDILRLGGASVTAYRVVRWPLLLAAAMLLFFTLYVAAPDVQRSGFRRAVPGAVLGVGVWALASVLFNVYVTHLGRYGATYGTLAGLVVFLLWVWILNLSLLLGAEFNVQLGMLPRRPDEPQE